MLKIKIKFVCLILIAFTTCSFAGNPFVRGKIKRISVFLQPNADGGLVAGDIAVWLDNNNWYKVGSINDPTGKAALALLMQVKNDIAYSVILEYSTGTVITNSVLDRNSLAIGIESN